MATQELPAYLVRVSISLNQTNTIKAVGFAPAQLPGLISIPSQQLTSGGPAIICQRWCSQIPTTWERPVIVPQTRVRTDSHFPAQFSLSMPFFVSSHLPYFSARCLCLFHPSIIKTLIFFHLKGEKGSKEEHHFQPKQKGGFQ